jgi:hypothetical protein
MNGGVEKLSDTRSKPESTVEFFKYKMLVLCLL